MVTLLWLPTLYTSLSISDTLILKHMKKIEAIIRKTKFEEVKDALLEADIEWFS